MSDKPRSQVPTGELSPRKAPSQARSAQTVDLILMAAGDVLERHGFDGYTTNAIAERAGVSIGSLYQYFPGKDAITVALIERTSGGLVEEMRGALQQQDPHAALRAAIAVAVRHQLLRPRLSRLLDFEERRLAALLPASGSATAILTQLAAFLARSACWRIERPNESAVEMIAIASALTDAAGARGDAQPVPLERRIEGAVLGYLDALAGAASSRAGAAEE